MTDNEIIKALECCSNAEPCENCPYQKQCDETDLAEIALDLINRQKAEIERLQNILLAFMGALTKVQNVEDIESISLIPIMWELNNQYRADIKAEAVKEFAERLKERARPTAEFCEVVLGADIDNLVKEMVGDTE